MINFYAIYENMAFTDETVIEKKAQNLASTMDRNAVIWFTVHGYIISCDENELICIISALYFIYSYTEQNFKWV